MAGVSLVSCPELLYCLAIIPVKGHQRKSPQDYKMQHIPRWNLLWTWDTKPECYSESCTPLVTPYLPSTHRCWPVETILIMLLWVESRIAITVQSAWLEASFETVSRGKNRRNCYQFDLARASSWRYSACLLWVQWRNSRNNDWSVQVNPVKHELSSYQKLWYLFHISFILNGFSR